MNDHRALEVLFYRSVREWLHETNLISTSFERVSFIQVAW
jgi:hypothetical protein